MIKLIGAYLPKGDREEEFEDKVRPILKMEGSIKSRTCNFTLSFESSSIPDTYHDKAVNYAVVVAIVSFFKKNYRKFQEFSFTLHRDISFRLCCLYVKWNTAILKR